jgi:ATP-GRASP peptide maturase of grasp-with-spasm system
MLLILSIAEDHATANVIDWLLYCNTAYDRINHLTLLGAEIKINNLNTSITLSNKQNYNLENYKTFWYRRGNFAIPTKLIENFKNSVCINALNKFNSDERNTVQGFIHNYLKTKTKNINEYNDIYLNKLSVLEKAKEFGLTIPDTIVTTKKTDVESFIKLHKNIITKAIYNGFSFVISDTNFYLHTLLIDEEDIKEFPDNFYVTQFQVCIDKAFELRIFYLEEKFFASAIFSQNDAQTKIDFRNYNESKPNRVIPFTLPNNLKLKIKKLMIALQLKSGSIDIIVTKKGEYVFLEVNPIGQFTQVSLPCNYYLEKHLAQALTK